jgi:hypothetical protein
MHKMHLSTKRTCRDAILHFLLAKHRNAILHFSLAKHRNAILHFSLAKYLEMVLIQRETNILLTPCVSLILRSSSLH